jgi:hypothetical protein
VNWPERITAAWRSSLSGILEAARLLAEAKEVAKDTVPLAGLGSDIFVKQTGSAIVKERVNDVTGGAPL